MQAGKPATLHADPPAVCDLSLRTAANLLLGARLRATFDKYVTQLKRSPANRRFKA
jgi:hypothetical protein